MFNEQIEVNVSDEVAGVGIVFLSLTPDPSQFFSVMLTTLHLK